MRPTRYRVLVLTSWGRSLCLVVGRRLDAKCRKLRGTRNLLGRLRTGSLIFRGQRKRSTKAHEIALNYFVLLGVIPGTPPWAAAFPRRGSSCRISAKRHIDIGNMSLPKNRKK